MIRGDGRGVFRRGLTGAGSGTRAGGGGSARLAASADSSFFSSRSMGRVAFWDGAGLIGSGAFFDQGAPSSGSALPRVELGLATAKGASAEIDPLSGPI